MDQFMEEVVSKRNKTGENLMFVLSWIMMIISGVFAVFMLNLLTMAISRQGFHAGMTFDIVITLLAIASAVLLFLNKDKMRTEYEYTFTNGILDFAKVFNNRKRKNLGTMNLKNIEAVGKVSSGSFQRYLKMPGVKRINWFLNREAELYYLYYQKDQQKTLMIIEPSEEMAKLIIRAAGQGKLQQN